MKLKMSPNSLFAILLRSPWWISIAVVGVFALAANALLPAPYVGFGVMGGFPFLVIGVIAAWQQFRAPDPARVAEALARAGTMGWPAFANAIEAGFVKQGYVVNRLQGADADFRLEKGARTSLVNCKRWKATNQGVEPLRSLVAAKDRLGADDCIYISLNPVTEQAQRFARAQGVTLITQNQLVEQFFQ